MTRSPNHHDTFPDTKGFTQGPRSQDHLRIFFQPVGSEAYLEDFLTPNAEDAVHDDARRTEELITIEENLAELTKALESSREVLREHREDEVKTVRKATCRGKDENGKGGTSESSVQRGGSKVAER